MELEIATLEAINAWEVLEYDPETMLNVIRLTWAFKCKQFPDGLIKKFKACFCARGDMQLEGIDFFETYAVNCCARYMFCPIHSHELALKRIGRYLKTTASRRMIINPMRELTIDVYPDADLQACMAMKSLLILHVRRVILDL